MIDFLTAADIGNSCVCLGVQRAARRLARRYDDAFRPLGITSGQFSILSALLTDRPLAIGTIAEILGMDRTTLNRNLKPLKEQGLVEMLDRESDARVRAPFLTAAGHDLLRRAVPIWRDAQAESHRRLGEGAWPTAQTHLRALS